MTTELRHWWCDASDAFDAWLARQTEGVREMDLLDQIALYGKIEGQPDDH